MTRMTFDPPPLDADEWHDREREVIEATAARIARGLADRRRQDDEWWTINVVAELLEMSPTAAARWLEERKVPVTADAQGEPIARAVDVGRAIDARRPPGENAHLDHRRAAAAALREQVRRRPDGRLSLPVRETDERRERFFGTDPAEAWQSLTGRRLRAAV